MDSWFAVRLTELDGLGTLSFANTGLCPPRRGPSGSGWPGCGLRVADGSALRTSSSQITRLAIRRGRYSQNSDARGPSVGPLREDLAGWQCLEIHLTTQCNVRTPVWFSAESDRVHWASCTDLNFTHRQTVKRKAASWGPTPSTHVSGRAPCSAGNHIGH